MNHLQRLHSQHIATYITALRETSTLLGTNTPVDDGDRVAVVDAHPSCKGAERRLEPELPAGVRSLVRLCEVHMVARAHRKVSTVLARTVTGMIRFAKCFTNAGEMADVRRCLFEIAMHFSKDGLRLGTPSAACQAYRYQVARWYNTGKGQWARAATLELLPTGDW